MTILLRYNGGTPLVGSVRSKDADEEPYVWAETVRAFFRVAAKGKRVPASARLQAPREHPWGLPDHALQIADDDGGNAFVLVLGGRARFASWTTRSRRPSRRGR